MKRLLMIVACVFAMASPAYAQIEQGDSELQLTGTMFTLEGMTSISATLLYGYFMTPNLEIGAGPTVSYSRTKTFVVDGFDVREETEEETDVSSLFFLNYNFSTSSTKVPYITATWYQVTFDIPENQEFTDYSFINAGGGIKFFLNEFVSYNVQGTYGFGLAESSEGIFIVTTGISAFF